MIWLGAQTANLANGASEVLSYDFTGEVMARGGGPPEGWTLDGITVGRNAVTGGFQAQVTALSWPGRSWPLVLNLGGTAALVQLGLGVPLREFGADPRLKLTILNTSGVSTIYNVSVGIVPGVWRGWC